VVIKKYNLDETPSRKKQVPNETYSGTAYTELPKKKRNLKWLLYLWLVVGILAVLSYGAKLINEWFDANRFEFHKPIEIKIQKPITIEQRQPLTIINPLAEIMKEPVAFKDLTEVEQMILDTFGIENYKIARAIAKSESGMRCNALHVNSNNTVDYGLYQLNSTHWDRFGGLENLVTCEQQVKSAYELFLEQGWEPWVVFKTGSFVEAL